MKKVIVTTTINPVTEAVRRFQAFEEWELVVIGDKKTPPDYRLDRGTYVTPEMQEEYDKALSDAIGWNCIQRRNFGLLWAHDMGADIVAVVDDDNIPYENWGKDLVIGQDVETNYYETDLPVFDPVGATNHSALWHRGFPLTLLSKRDYSRKSKKTIRPDVQADFWDGDPDIDAFCRMEHAPECKFDESYFPIAANKMAPFNSQNTFMAGRILKDYFLYPHVGRMDDIWAAYYVQAKGVNVVFAKASVYQQRNVHDLTKDMKAEYLGYEHNHKIVSEIVGDPDKILNYLPERSVEAFHLYRKHFTNA
jgi:disulfide oxidoreductase YuzD